MRILAAAATAVIVAFTGAAQAAVTSFSSQSAFEAACGTLEKVTFNHFWDGSLEHLPQKPDFLGEHSGAGGVTITSKSKSSDQFQAARETALGVRTVPASFHSITKPYDSAFIASTFGNPLTASLRSGVFSVAGHFGILNGTSPGASLSLYSGTTMLTRHVFNAANLGPGQPGSFVGFTSDQEITSVVFDAPGNYEAISDMSLGGQSPAPSPVPLPAGFALLLTALSGTALLRRRG